MELVAGGEGALETEGEDDVVLGAEGVLEGGVGVGVGTEAFLLDASFGREISGDGLEDTGRDSSFDDSEKNSSSKEMLEKKNLAELSKTFSVL